MARHGFGQGRYRYFGEPLPELVAALRHQLYERLWPVAVRWAERMDLPGQWPATHAAFRERCRTAGQTKPTPLLLRYGRGDYNCLHQDLYGQVHFPLQVIFMLNCPERDYAGGELVLVEQRPRMQSRPMVFRPALGSFVVLAVRERPRRGARRFVRTQLRHGVAQVRSGERFTLGILFHDAS
jgi:hypothetical protein